MKKLPLSGKITIIFIACIIIANIGINLLSMYKGIIVLNYNNIVNELKNNRTLGQKFKIESDTYEVCNYFLNTYSSNSMDPPEDIDYENYHFIIHIKSDIDDGYYMAAMIRTTKNHNNQIVKSLLNKESVDLTGLVSTLNYKIGSKSIKEEFYKVLGPEHQNVLEYSINVE